MTVLKFIISTFAILNVLGEDVTTSSEYEMDLVIDMLLKNEIAEYTNSVENAIEEESIAEPVFSNGVWKCGKCEDIDESRPVYTETYSVVTNDDEESPIILQVGLSLQKISCVMVTTSVPGELSSVERVSGNCAGNGAILRVNGAVQCEVKE